MHAVRGRFEDERPFQREYQGIQKFEPVSRSHEGLVDILQVGGTDDCFYYVMELADDAFGEKEKRSEGERESKTPVPVAAGEAVVASSPFPPFSPARYTPRTLRYEIKRQGALPPDECVAIGQALADALNYLHSRGLVHRDIKPSNIVFVNGTPKLADIGLVTDVDATRSYVGTEGFMPPEGPGTPQADIYSLGKVLYEMCTGKGRQEFPDLPTELRPGSARGPRVQSGVSPDYPVQQTDSPPAEQTNKICGEPRALPFTPADRNALLELNEIFTKACATDPRQRYQTADELHTELAVLQRGQSVKRQRAVSRRFAIARKVVFGAMVVALLFAVLPFVKVLKHGQVENPEAVRLYELGRHYYAQLTDESLKKAVDYLTQATQIDPGFTPAYITLFEIYCWNPGGISDKEKFLRVREIATKLMAIDPGLAEAHAASSWARFGAGDWRTAEQEMHRAIQHKPNYGTAHGIYGFYLARPNAGNNSAARIAMMAMTTRSSMRVNEARSDGLLRFPITERRFIKTISCCSLNTDSPPAPESPA